MDPDAAGEGNDHDGVNRKSTARGGAMGAASLGAAPM
jgi:hypothetical protein